MVADRTSIKIMHIAAQTVLDRCGERRIDREWVEAQRCSPNARFYLLIDLRFVIDSNSDKTNTRLRPFRAGDLSALGIEPERAFLLGIGKDGAPVFTVALSQADAIALPGGEEALAPIVDLRSLANQSDMRPEELTLAAQARSLAAWHATQRCCGRCGGRTRPRDGGWRLQCWACGQSHFPRSDPAVIMLVTHKGRCLLGNEPRFPEKMYSVLAGFVEPGDDIETAVRREIMEEVGVRVGRVEYVASQPWPFQHSLMIGCWGEALNEDLTIDPTEINDARWFSIDEVSAMLEQRHDEGLFVPPPLSISHTLIRAFVEGNIA